MCLEFEAKEGPEGSLFLRQPGRGSDEEGVKERRGGKEHLYREGKQETVR